MGRWTCTQCGAIVVDSPKCPSCTGKTSRQPRVPGSKSSFRLVLAVIPALVGIFMVLQDAGPALGAGVSGETRLGDDLCIATYGMSAEMKAVPAGSTSRRRQQPATSIRGMIRNDCDRDLRQVRLQLELLSDTGKRALNWVRVGKLRTGEATEFEAAWKGRLASYQVTGVRFDAD